MRNLELLLSGWSNVCPVQIAAELDANSPLQLACHMEHGERLCNSFRLGKECRATQNDLSDWWNLHSQFMATQPQCRTA